MSAIEIILSRAMNDAEFDELLFTDPDKAVAEYDLSAEEYAKLKSLTRTAFGALAIEQRKSMGKLNGNLQIATFYQGGSQP
jgi:hypothetical protein